MSMTLIIPCYNEEANITKLFKKFNSLIKNIKKIKNFKFNIILIENGSTDKTRINIRKEIKNSSNKKFIKILYIDQNQGYGYGIIQGIKICNSQTISWAHSDLQTDLNDIYKAILLAKKSDNISKTVIKGHRVSRSFLDNIISKFMSLIVYIFTMIYLQDINAQPKIFPSDLCKDLFIKCPYDFNLDLHLMLTAKKRKYKFKQFDVDFKKRTGSKAKGAGSPFGKIIVSLSVIRYLINRLKS